MPHGFTGERNLPLDQLISEYPGANFDKVKDVIDSCSLNQHQLDEIMKDCEATLSHRRPKHACAACGIGISKVI